ncbi:MAG: low temperature requirement protein A, partial [Atopobiaceae bacterium]|nr:low temperature requirement protein A [Atopobiaceae bacterium]
WALILLNLLIHWVIKSRSYDNLDEDDRRIMEAVITVIAAEFVFVVCAAYLEGTPGVVATYIAMAISIGAFSIPPIYRRIFRRKPARFAHLAERCALLTIVAFGETIVAISSYMVTTSSMLYSALVFALVVGLFLIYIFEHDNMLDHHMRTDGLSFTSITVWMIMIIGNLTVALEFMSMWNIAFLPKSVYLMMCLVLYLLTSFVLGRYNRPEFHWSPAYIAGRISACAIVFVGAFITDFDPTITLVVDVIAVWFALWHEWLLYHRRMKLVMFGRTLGDTDEDDEAA